jgi:hypothetical protein
VRVALPRSQRQPHDASLGALLIVVIVFGGNEFIVIVIVDINDAMFTVVVVIIVIMLVCESCSCSGTRAPCAYRSVTRLVVVVVVRGQDTRRRTPCAPCSTTCTAECRACRLLCRLSGTLLR